MRLFKEYSQSTSVSLLSQVQYIVRFGACLIKAPDCMNRDDFDYEFHQEKDPYDVDHGPPYRHEHTHGIEPHDPALEHPCSELKKILSGGTFYYSLTFDLTNRLQDRYVKFITSRVGKSYSLLDCRSSLHLISTI